MSQEPKKNFFEKLSPKEIEVIVNKGTERPFSGKYNDFYENGLYVCKAAQLSFIVRVCISTRRPSL